MYKDAPCMERVLQERQAASQHKLHPPTQPEVCRAETDGCRTTSSTTHSTANSTTHQPLLSQVLTFLLPLLGNKRPSLHPTSTMTCNHM
jgi:hypothetical protein